MKQQYVVHQYKAFLSIKIANSTHIISPPQAWAQPAPDRRRWRSEEPAWPASAPRRCSAGFSPAQPASSKLWGSEQAPHVAPSIQKPTSLVRAWTIGTHTLFGLLKEFSSMTLPDVRTVAVDPSALTLAPSPLVETVRLTVSDPKFTTCTAEATWERNTFSRAG